MQEVTLAIKLRLIFRPLDIDWDDDYSLSFTSFFTIVSQRNHERVGDEGLYIGTKMVYPRALVLVMSMVFWQFR